MMVQEEELNGAGLVVPGAGGAAKSIINVLEGGFYKHMYCCSLYRSYAFLKSECGLIC